jgi:hypothetical protein
MSPVATQSVASIALPSHDPTVTVATLIDLFMSQYAGRDSTRPQRLRWWQEQCGTLTLADINDDPDAIADALDRLEQRHGMYYGGSDATGHVIMRNKSRPIAGSTVNRYAAAIASVLAWAAKKRITPKGWVNPEHVEGELETKWKNRTEMIEDITKAERDLRAAEGYVHAIQHPGSALPVAAAMDQAELKGHILKVA